jgi:hypothetical protein
VNNYSHRTFVTDVTHFKSTSCLIAHFQLQIITINGLVRQLSAELSWKISRENIDIHGDYCSGSHVASETKSSRTFSFSDDFWRRASGVVFYCNHSLHSSAVNRRHRLYTASAANKKFGYSLAVN